MPMVSGMPAMRYHGYERGDILRGLAERPPILHFLGKCTPRNGLSISLQKDEAALHAIGCQNKTASRRGRTTAKFRNRRQDVT
jgi:hypothetical protein